MLTKRHTTLALARADRKRAGLHRFHQQPFRRHWRQADAIVGRNLACNTLTAESLHRCIATCTDLNVSQERISSTETPATDTNITGWWDDRPSTSVLGSTYATKKACFSAKIIVRVHAGVVVVFPRRSQIDEMTREGTAQSVTVPCKSRKNGRIWGLQSWTRSKFQIARRYVRRTRVCT